MSFLYADNGRNYTSHMSLDIKDKAESITIYVRNNLKINGKTFKIEVLEMEDSFSFVSNIYTILSALFATTLCCLCIVGFCKCFINR